MSPGCQPEHQDPPAAVCMEASALATVLPGTPDATAPQHAHVKFLHAFGLCTAQSWCTRIKEQRTCMHLDYALAHKPHTAAPGDDLGAGIPSDIHH